MTRLAHLRLLQMTSQAFPIGGYSHSGGLEAAIESRAAFDEASVLRWIIDVLQFSLCSYEIPVLKELHAAWAVQDAADLGRLNAEFLASRESAELRAATLQMGFSMHRVLQVLPDVPSFVVECLDSLPALCLPCVWSGAACGWRISAADCASAYLWSWAENQVLVAMKCVPIGQSSGQRILSSIGEWIASVIDEPAADTEHLRSNFAPALAIESSRHETQYSRLFRS